MLELPSAGLVRSIGEHNCSVSHVWDWLSTSLAFEVETITKSDVIGILKDEDIYEKSGFAFEFVSNVWLMAQAHQAIYGDGSAFHVKGDRITRTMTWEEAPEYAFMLFLSYAHLADVPNPDGNYDKQGELFERLTAASLDYFGFNAFRVGWSGGAARKIAEVQRLVGDSLREL